MESKLIHSKPDETQVQKPNLTGIPTQMKLDFERRSGLSFDDVRVHYNSDKPARLGALAYTQGNQIHVGPGQESSLPHELGHVIQQKAGRVRPTRWIGGLPVNDQPELEREADLAPVQCMPAPALWGVIQMDLETMEAQKGCNCGYHALARALLRFIPPKHKYNKDNLEIYLTSFAIQTGFSVIGEAFDPYALAHVGNEFCKNEGIHAQCLVHAYTSAFELSTLLNTSYGTGSVILLPYFPDPVSMGAGQNDLQAPRENAHWSAIDTIEGSPYKLYEGNFHGSTGHHQASLPADVTPNDLFLSNQSILPQFNWNTFLTTRSLSSINKLKEKVVVNSFASNSGPFPNAAAFRQHIQTVIQNISQISNVSNPAGTFSGTQDVYLKGLAVEVKGQ